MPRRRGRKPGRSRPQAARKARRRGRAASARRGVWKWALLAVLLAGFGCLIYGVHLDQTIRLRFGGKRWALPARVYARPLELYAGAPLSTPKLQAELTRLRYRRVRHPDQPGAYSSYQGRFLLRTRRFQFWDGEEPSRYLELRLADGRVQSLRDAGSGKSLSIVRLEAPQIASIYPTQREDRVLVRRQDLPPMLVQALLAVEDRDYFHHHGIDLGAIARALWQNLRAGALVQGGSTLTQQLVKSFFLSPERTLWRKLNEAAMALLLEWRYDKDELLEAYANEIYLGQQGARAIHGFGLASRFYFDRPLEALDLAQTALLVALVRGPSLYDPRRHPQRARERRNLVLEQLAARQAVTPEAATAAKAAPLGVTPEAAGIAASYPAFVDLVRRQLHRDYRDEDLSSEGLRIFTTMDPWVQQQVEQALGRRLERLERERRLTTGKLEGAVVVARVDGAEVLAVVGGRQAGFAGFNRALDAVRPVGSLVKPVVYLEALSRPGSYTLTTRLEDAPLRVKGPRGKVWAPQNYDRVGHGRVPLHEALAQSYNLATVRLGLELGLESVVRRLHRLGVERPVDAYPSLLLGALSLAPIEVTQIYQSLAAGGFLSPLRTITEVLDAENRPLSRYPLTLSRTADAGAVYLLDWVLQEVVSRGTGRSLGQRLQQGPRVAGKTGTTDDLRDSWFAGFSGDMVATVWVGRDDNQPAGLSGAAGAMQVWGDIIAATSTASVDLVQPASVERAWIETDSGLRADADCDGARELPFIKGSAPTEQAPCMGSRAPGFLRRLFQ